MNQDVDVSRLAATGTTGIHFHDLRHAGNLLIAHAGANLRELMDAWATPAAAPR